MITSFQGKYRFLSNFYPCHIAFGGFLYPTVEHAYQAAKTNDVNTRYIIARMQTPGQAKRAGRKVQMRPDWDKVKKSIMLELVLKKFSKEPFKTWLLDTQGSELIEGNAWGDTYWGMVYRNGEWVGQNNLGKILMLVREQVK